MNWDNDEEVVKAACPEWADRGWIPPGGSSWWMEDCRGHKIIEISSSATREDLFALARQHPSVVAWEKENRPVTASEVAAYVAAEGDMELADKVKESIKASRPVLSVGEDGPAMDVTDEDRAEAYALGHLGPQATLLEWLACRRRQVRELSNALAEKEKELAEARTKLEHVVFVYQCDTCAFIANPSDIGKRCRNCNGTCWGFPTSTAAETAMVRLSNALAAAEAKGKEEGLRKALEAVREYRSRVHLGSVSDYNLGYNTASNASEKAILALIPGEKVQA